jgi:hypothetical protein
MLRANPRILRTALFSALGLAPLGCGGAFRDATGDGGAGGGGASGAVGTAGTPAGGKPSGGAGASGGTASAGQPSGGSTASGGAASLFPCDEPMDLGGGYEQCESGTIHRPKISECPSSLPRAVLEIAPPAEGNCFSDLDCTAAPHGYCRSATGNQLPGVYCAYGCVKDSECGPGNICVCGDPVGHCAPATCSSDADCGDGLRCQSYDPSGGCGSQSFACQTPQDTCGGDADCTGAFCVATNGPFTCDPGGCAIGRPFLVEGQERLAEVVARADWCQGELDFGHLSPELRRAASAEWSRIGQMEHASVAAFARFALQLLQLGAPPELVELATAAMADETRHARLAFGVASSFAERPFGPGPLKVDGSLLETALLDVVRLTIREGCIGETTAALEAREAALHASSPDLARMLGGIADDEGRHAELAWRFVAWALEQDGEGVARVLEAELRRAQNELGQAGQTSASADELTLLAVGVLPQHMRRALGNAAFREVIEPCARSLSAGRRVRSRENQVLSA